MPQSHYMRSLLLACCLLLSAPAWSETSQQNIPLGKLPDAARPTAYRLDMTIIPDQPRFSGHNEIDVVLKQPTRSLYLHGRGLNVRRVAANASGKTVSATWQEVDPSGVARLDFESDLPSGPITLVFDFDGAFSDTPSSLHRTKVGESWYSWSQFESIDARGTFPSFDEPGFKTPFSISITTRPGFTAVSNAAEISVTADSGLERHTFAPTLPLPTYLVALVTGPFVRTAGFVPADDIRKAPLPLATVATQPQRDKMGYVMAETPRIVELLEGYFGEPFPFPKLDQIGSPTMPGAMENAGADIYSDPVILLDANASTRQKQSFGAVVAHELAHQWFGDLVTPAWWDDIWLNESFANWMGYRIGNEWRPELNIGIEGLTSGFEAMNTDSLEVGRPIHQLITKSSEIDSAFDGITYGKGGHVISMMAAYLGDERFREGVRLHMARHRYGNATSDDFFASLADAANDPRLVSAMKSFVDQPGVPVVDLRRFGGKLTATQTRYTFLGGTPSNEQWTIPLCIRAGTTRTCTLLDTPRKKLDVASGVLMPNVGGTGYYRFNLSSADWKALIRQSSKLQPAEAIAVTDSLWAAFRAGKADPALLILAAREMATHPDSNVAVDGGLRLAGLRSQGIIGSEANDSYRRLMTEIYAPELSKLGFDPTTAAHATDSPDKQSRRQALVGLVARQGGDQIIRKRLLAAADAYLAGDKTALDQGYFGTAFSVSVEERGVPGAKILVDQALHSEDAVFRRAALVAAADSGRIDVARWLLDLHDSRMRMIERFMSVSILATRPGTRDFAGDWLLTNYEAVAAGNGIFLSSRLPQALSTQCSVEQANRINEVLGPKVRALNAGVLDFQRVVETVHHCGVLKNARTAVVTRAVERAA